MATDYSDGRFICLVLLFILFLCFLDYIYFQKRHKGNKMRHVLLKLSRKAFTLVKKDSKGSSLHFSWEAHVCFRDLSCNLENR